MSASRCLISFRRMAMTALVVVVGIAPAPGAQEDLRRQPFDRDPGWDGSNNRPTSSQPRRIRQDFGWSRTANAGGTAGGIGGFETPAAEVAYYGKQLPDLTLDRPLTASGKVVVGPGDAKGNVLVGFFNAATLNEWRTPNTIAFRLNGRGKGFHAHVEYATRRWRAGGDFFAQEAAGGRRTAREIAGGSMVHSWSLRYDPAGNNGRGRILATLNGETLALNLDPGHRGDGATFNRFGILNVMKSADDGGEIWLDDLEINGVRETLDRDGGWDGRQNRHTYLTRNVRPWFDFGFSPTRHAGGRAAGELGGLIFRGDERYAERLAFYGDRLEPLSLESPLRAGGKVCLRRGVTDSTVLVGFFHATESLRPSMAQQSGIPENFLGLAVEGPSREGFCFYPLYGTEREATGLAARPEDGPRIYPDGRAHDWTLQYSPTPGPGRITVTLDGTAVSLKLRPEHRSVGARLNRFGIVTTHIDGNAQEVYLDDLEYTWRAAK